MMKHKVFLAGMLASLLALGMAVVSCGGNDDGGGGTETPGGGTETPGGGTETPGGGTETPNTEAKKIKFTNLPSFADGLDVAVIIRKGGVDVAQGTGNVFSSTYTFDLYSATGVSKWTDTGQYDVYLITEHNSDFHTYKISISIDSALTTIDFDDLAVEP